MNAGELRHWVRFEEVSDAPTQDPLTGELVYSWVEVLSTWAKVSPLSGNAYLAAQAAQSSATSRLLMRHTDIEITTAMRVVHAGRTYTIESPPLEDEKSGREYVNILIARGVNVVGI